MFYLSNDKWHYWNLVGVIDGSKDLFCGFDIDTEYTRGIYWREGQINITAQIKGVSDDIGKIYAHPDITKKIERIDYCWLGNPRHKVLSDWIVIDYLRDWGYEVSLKTHPNEQQFNKNFKDLPIITIDLYAFYMVVDYLGIVTGKFRNDLFNLSIGKYNKAGIKLTKKLMTFIKHEKYTKDYVNLPWIITINGFKYKVRLRFFDVCGLHGNISYLETAKNVGLDLESKESISQEEKEDMLWTYINNVNYDNYSLGDLRNREILVMHEKLLHNLYTEMGLEEQWKGVKSVKLTVGSTDAALIKSYLFSEGLTKDLMEGLCRYSNAKTLNNNQNTKLYLMKVDGGRCFNNRPLTTVTKHYKDTFRLLDIDIKGAYTTAQKLLSYPIGNPLIIDYDIKGVSPNKYMKLGDFLKEFKKELVPGMWFARVSTKEGYILKWDQDIFVSWFPGKLKTIFTNTKKEQDTKMYSIEDVGYTRVLSNQINLAVINHDLVEWLDNVASEKQREELKQNLVVVAAMIYPKSKEVDSPEILSELYNNFKKECEDLEIGNETIIDLEKDITTKTKKEFNYWCRLPYGSNFIKQLQEKRTHFQEQIKKEELSKEEKEKANSLQKLFKLFLNTAYGVMVSEFFDIGNTCLGNNITAQVRTVMWCIEKAFNGYQSITDGCVINLDEIPNVYKKDENLNGFNTVASYRKLAAKRGWGVKEIDLLDEGMTINWIFINQWLESKLNETFKGITTLENYKLEIKHILNKAMFKGLGDYIFYEVIINDKCKERKEIIEKYIGMQYYTQWSNDNEISINTIENKVNYDLYKLAKMRSQNSKSFQELQEEIYSEYELLDLIKNGVYDTEELLTKVNIKYVSFKGIKLNYWLALLNKNSIIGFLYLIKTKPATISESVFSKMEDINNVERMNPSIQGKPVKQAKFKNNIKSYETKNIMIGEYEDEVKLITEINLGQFLYRTKEQYLGFKKEHEGWKAKYSQGYERYFINKNENLDYQKAIETIDKAIDLGYERLSDYVKNELKQVTSRKNLYHPKHECKEVLKREINTGYTNDDFDDE